MANQDDLNKARDEFLHVVRLVGVEKAIQMFERGIREYLDSFTNEDGMIDLSKMRR